MEDLPEIRDIVSNMEELRSNSERMTSVAIQLQQKLQTSNRKSKVATCNLILDLMCQETNTRLVSRLKMLMLPLGEFLQELAKDTQSSDLAQILPSLRKCINKRVVMYKDLPFRLREQLAILLITQRIDDKLFKQCLLMFNSFAHDCHVISIIVDLFFNVLDGEAEISNLTHNCDGTKISRFTLVIISLLQNILNCDSYPYERCEWIANKILLILRSKCKDIKFCNLLKMFVNDLMNLSCDLSWPVTAIVITNLCERLVSDATTLTDCRYITFVLNLLKDITLVIRRNDAKFREKELLFHDTFKPIEPGLREVIICVAANKRVNVFGGDILKAYAAVWRSSGENDAQSSLPCITEYDAQVAKYLIDFNKLTIPLFVNCFIKGCSNPTKSVKSTAFKCLCDILEHTPNLLRDVRVCSILKESLPHLNAQGKVGLANILGTYVELEPSKMLDFKPIFKALLVDSAKSVTQATIKSLSNIYSRHEETDCELQDCIISLYNSMEGTERRSIVKFFLRVWLRGKHIQTFFQQCGKDIHKKVIFNILRQLQYEVNQESQNYLTQHISNLVQISITYVHSGEASLSLGAANLLKNVAKTFPNLVEGQIPVLQNMLFNSCNELQITICKTLILLADKIKNYGSDFSQTIENTLPKLRLTLNPHNHVLIIKLLVAIGGNDQLKKLLMFGIQHLNQVQNLNKSASAKINESICYAILLSNFNKNPPIANIIRNLLKNPKHSSTILIALGEVRNEFIPSKTDPDLLELLAQFLEDESNVARLLDTLHYLKNLLRGYRNIIQNPELRTLGDSTTEYVSHTLQHCLRHITRCVLSRNELIRRNAGNVIFYIDRSGLILFPKLLPSIVAMTTETNVTIRKYAIMVLSHRRQWGIASSVECLNACYKLALSLNPKCVIRGFNLENFQPICHAWLSIIQESRQNLKSLITKIFNEYCKTDNLELAVFLIDNVVYLQFKHLDDVDFLVNLIKKCIVGNLESLEKLCYLKKAETYINYVYNLPRRIVLRSPTNRNELVYRKAPEYDYLPHLETNRYAIKNEEFEGDEFNVPLAVLRRQMIGDVVEKNAIKEESIPTLPETEDDVIIPESSNTSSTEVSKLKVPNVILRRLSQNDISKWRVEATIQVDEQSGRDGNPNEMGGRKNCSEISRQVTEENEKVKNPEAKTNKRRRERSLGETDKQSGDDGNPNDPGGNTRPGKKSRLAVKRVRWSL